MSVQSPEPDGPRKRKMRKFTWFILAVNVLFLIWVIAGVSGNINNCDGKIGQALDSCQAGTAVGTGIGVALIIGLWAFIDIILGVLWLVTNRRHQ